jgi:hypothetical protein
MVAVHGRLALEPWQLRPSRDLNGAVHWQWSTGGRPGTVTVRVRVVRPWTPATAPPGRAREPARILVGPGLSQGVLSREKPGGRLEGELLSRLLPIKSTQRQLCVWARAGGTRVFGRFPQRPQAHLGRERLTGCAFVRCAAPRGSRSQRAAQLRETEGG